jgi:shikimate kinase
MQNIILCGFMGCGKTTVGKKLAALTGRPFIDMDEYIEQQAGITISEIFRRFGEEDFRRRERMACADIAALEGTIIATGGGALTFPENVATLAATGKIILLDTPLSVILDRLEQNNTRPLLACSDRTAAAKEMYERRLPLYCQAASVVVKASGTPDKVAGTICQELGIDSQTT